MRSSRNKGEIHGRGRLAGALVLVAVAAGAIGGSAQSPPSPDVSVPAPPSQASADDKRQELEQIRARIRTIAAQIERNRSVAVSVSTELERLGLAIDLAYQEWAAAAKALEIADAQIAATGAAAAALAERIGSGETYLRRRVVSLYKLGRLSYLRYLLAARQGRELANAIKYTSYLARRDARALAEYREATRQLAETALRLDVQRREKSTQLAQVSRQREAYAARRAERERYLARLQEESKRGRLQVTSLEERATRLESLLRLLFESARGGTASSPIAGFKGVLDWPVQGRVVGRFGVQRHPVFGTETRRTGIEIEAAPGTPVAAVFAGDVLYARWFKGYGNMIVIDHRDKVFSLYAHLARVEVAAGERVTIGQRIAAVGGDGEEKEPFYFELRVANEPVDPTGWLR